MIELIFLALFGIVVGILTGLLPALPVFTGPFLLFYFYNDFPLEHLLVFWLAVVSGSQFFGSIAVITTRIPGEESSLVYINDLDGLSQKVKNQLLYSTAHGSLIAALLSSLFVWFCVQFINIGDVPWLMGVEFQYTVYMLALLSFIFVSGQYGWSLLLIALGIMLGPKQNYAIPDEWFILQHYTQGYTFYMLALGVIVFPDVFMSSSAKATIDEHFEILKDKSFSYYQGIKSSLIGLAAGLVPGPSASLAAVAAYRTAGKDKTKKIIAAETANNASVITCSIPLLLMAMPINFNTLLMSNIVDLKGMTIFDEILEPSVLGGLRVIDTTLLVLVGSVIVYYVLATHLIDWYAKFIVAIHHRMKVILFTILSGLIAVDLWASELTIVSYLMLLSAFAALGFFLKHKQVSPLPFLFATILGDKLVWLNIQAFNIYLN
jgi:TctA family transporter